MCAEGTVVKAHPRWRLGSAWGPDLETACADYIASANTCLEDAGGTAVADTFCDSYAGITGEAATNAATYFECLTAAYDGADCTDPDAFTAVSEDSTTCVTDYAAM